MIEAPRPGDAGWLRLLPAFVRARLAGRPRLQAALDSSGWLFADRVVRLGAGLIVGVWVARYLGPEQFGRWNFAIAFAALFGAVAAMGLDNWLVRELVYEPARRDELLGTAFGLRFAGAAVAVVAAVTGVAWVRPGDGESAWLVACSAAAFLFQSTSVIDLYFQSRVESRYVVLAANAAFLGATAVRLALLLTGAPLAAFVWTALGEAALTAVLLVAAYRLRGASPLAWRFDFTAARRMLGESWWLILSSLTVMLYLRLDQVMIGQMLGDAEVGLFSAAVRVSEVWYFVPLVIVTSAFPAVLEAKQHDEALYRARLERLYRIMIWLGLGVAAVTTFMAPFIVRLLYGAAYAPAARVLAIQIWAGVVVCLSTVHSRWLVVEGLQRYNLLYTSVGAAVNLAGNLVLIPRYGIAGAAVATLLAQYTAVPLLFVLKRARPNFFLIARAVLP